MWCCSRQKCIICVGRRQLSWGAILHLLNISSKVNIDENLTRQKYTHAIKFVRKCSTASIVCFLSVHNELLGKMHCTLDPSSARLTNHRSQIIHFCRESSNQHHMRSGWQNLDRSVAKTSHHKKNMASLWPHLRCKGSTYCTSSTVHVQLTVTPDIVRWQTCATVRSPERYLSEVFVSVFTLYSLKLVLFIPDAAIKSSSVIKFLLHHHYQFNDWAANEQI